MSFSRAKNNWLLILASFLACGILPVNAAGESSDYLVDVWTSDNDLPDTSITSITQTPDGYLWIGTYNGLARFDGVRFVSFDPVNTPELKHARVVGLFLEPDGTLWINTYDGSMTSLRNGVFTQAWQGSQVSGVFSRSNEVFFATLSGNLYFRQKNLPGTNGWQMINFDRHLGGTFFRETAGGEFWYVLRDGKLGRIIGTNAVLLPDNIGLEDERINCLTSGADGQVLVGTEKKILRWNGTRFQDVTPTNGEAVINVSFLFCQTGDDFWAFANGTVRHALGRQWTTNVESWQDLGQAAGFYVSAYQEQNGDVWFRQFGLGLFHAATNGTTSRISSANGLPGNRVNCWFQDREGNRWVGIDRGGLVRLRKKQFQVIGAGEGLPNPAVSTICEDANTNIWLGTFGGGLNRWRDGELTRFDLPEGANRGTFFSSHPDAQGRLWLSASREDLFLLETNQISRHPEAIHGIKTILVDHRGRVWLGRQSGLTCIENGVSRNYVEADGFERRDVRALAEDTQGVIWIGTGNGVLYKFENDKFASFTPHDGLENQAIWSLLPDADGAIWVGTFRGGLLRFKDGKFSRYTMRNGLPSDIICQILDDGLGKLWIGSHKGIFYLSKNSVNAFDHGQIPSLPCTAYGLYDGLPTLECSGNYQPACWRDHAGRLWFATVKGAVAVSPEQIRPNRLLPPVVIEDFFVDDEKFEAAATPAARQISPGKHQFDFHFTALSFSAPDKVRFRYRLVGFDNAWVEAGVKRAAHYGPLPPGEYHFQVTACNNDGLWNAEGAGITLKQLPFFWQTWWFISLMSLGFVGVISAAVRHAATRSLQKKLAFLKQQRAIERERERIAQDIHDDLGAGLTQIMLQSSLARRETPGQMQTDLTQISETARDLVRTMDEIVWAIDPENDSLDGLVTYIGKFVQEFLAVAKLRCRLDLPAQVPAITVSAETRHNLFLAIKEAFNNVVKHSQATEVSFQLKIQPATFTFIIKDNGCGFTPGGAAETNGDPARLSAGHGLRNLARRLEEMGGTCALTSRPGQGTQVELTVPVQCSVSKSVMNFPS